MAGAARQCIKALDMKQQDISMLFLLSKIDWLQRFPAGERLVDWVREQVKLAHVCSDEFRLEVKRVFKERGIRPVAPERYVFATTKEECKNMCSSAGWPEPFFPVMLQTRAKGAAGFSKKEQIKERYKGPGGVFIIFSCWQDAFFELIQMAKTKKFKGYAADIIFENQIVDMGPRRVSFPCRIILDCDAKESEFDNKFTVEELEGVIDQVAPWFVGELVKHGAIKATDQVVCFKKKKSRAGKASSHLIFDLMGIPTLDTREVLERIFIAPWLKDQQRKEEEKGENDPPRKKARPGPAKLPEPWMVTDRSTMHGRNQFSTLLWMNPDKCETEYPFVESRLVIVNGEVVEKLSIKAKREESGPDHPKALSLLHCCCYSSLVPDFVTLSPDFMIDKTEKKRGGGGPRAGPSTSTVPGGASPRSMATDFLPPWMESAIARITGRGAYAVNKSMPSLDRMHSHLAKFIPEATRENTFHMLGALYCPNNQEKPRVHSSNGTYVIRVGEDLFVRCSDSSCNHGGSGQMVAEMVEGTATLRNPWVKYTEAAYAILEDRAKQHK